MDLMVAYSKQNIVALQRYGKTSNKFLKTASNFLVQRNEIHSHEAGAILKRNNYHFLKDFFFELRKKD